jgi:hypothetical protein
MTVCKKLVQLRGSHTKIFTVEEIKQISGPSSGLTYEASQLVTKKTSATKKQVAIVGLVRLKILIS